MPDVDFSVAQDSAPVATDQQAPAAAPEPDVLSRILEHQEALGRRVDTALGAVEQQTSTPPELPEQPGDDEIEAAVRAMFGESEPALEPDGFDPEEGIDLAAFARLLSKTSQTAAEKAARAAVEPLLQREIEQDRDEAFAALEDKHPQLQAPEVQDAVIRAAADSAARLGQPDLLFNPEFVELAFLAYQAREGNLAAGEQPAPSEPGMLERATGANPTPAEDDPLEAEGDAVVAAGKKSSYWGF
jgi:hypothetical protein